MSAQSEMNVSWWVQLGFTERMTLHLELRSPNLFHKEPDNKYFKPCRPDGLYYNFVALSLQPESVIDSREMNGNAYVPTEL